MTKCKCGCGKDAVKGKTFLQGHYSTWMVAQRKAELIKASEIKKANIVSQPPQIAPPLPPTIKDRELALQKQELDFLEKFTGGNHQNTAITQDERLLIGIAYKSLVSNVYPTSKRYCQDNGISWDDTEFFDSTVFDFLLNYLDFGLPVNRLGRDEVVRVMESYFLQKHEEKPKDEKIIT